MRFIKCNCFFIKILPVLIQCLARTCYARMSYDFPLRFGILRYTAVPYRYDFSRFSIFSKIKLDFRSFVHIFLNFQNLISRFGLFYLTFFIFCVSFLPREDKKNGYNYLKDPSMVGYDGKNRFLDSQSERLIFKNC
mgnify:CR=1 FL=1